MKAKLLWLKLSQNTGWLAGCLLVLSAGLGLAYCAQRNQMGGEGQGGFGPGGGPGGPNAQYYTNSAGSNSGRRSDNSFYKSGSVLENEERWGVSAPLTISSRSAFEEYRLGLPYNTQDDIEDFRVYVDLEKVKNQNTYTGKVTIQYYDWEDNGRPKNTTYETRAAREAQYNLWFNLNDERYFHGFFQNTQADTEGALVLVIDRKTKTLQDADDRDTEKFYGGSLWIMNFRTTFKGANSCNNQNQNYVFEYNQRGFNQLPTLASRDKPCWEITSGPYDCRTWRRGDGVHPTRAVKPDGSCYEELAEFEGLDVLKAFNVRRLGDLGLN